MGLERGRGRALSSNKIKTISVLKQSPYRHQKPLQTSNKIKTISVLKQYSERFKTVFCRFSNKIKYDSVLKHHSIGW